MILALLEPAPMLIAGLAYPTHRGKYTSAYWTMYYLGKYRMYKLRLSFECLLCIV